MSFWSMLAEQLWSARTPFLVVAYVVVQALASRTPTVERYHMRAAATLLVLHVIATTVAAAQATFDYDPTIAELAGLSFQLLAAVTLATTAVFRTLLPRVGWALPRIMIDLITAVGVLVVFIVVGKRAGFSVAGLITTSAVLTAVIGFSLQDTLGNVMGGLSVQLDKSLKVGDWITLGTGQTSGRVTEIRWRYTAIETRAWDTVIIPNGKEEREVARLVAGQFFGEMSLMTGEARTASVVASTDMVCYRIDKPAFQSILRATPSIADQIAEVLVHRRTALTAARDEHEDAKRRRVETAKQDLLGRIRGFFGIPHAN